MSVSKKTEMEDVPDLGGRRCRGRDDSLCVMGVDYLKSGVRVVCLSSLRDPCHDLDDDVGWGMDWRT